MTLPFFREWRAADKQASAAEREIRRIAFKAIKDGAADALPSASSVQAAKRLRHTADDLFAVAMNEIEAEARRLRR